MYKINGKTIDLKSAKEIAAGGEGRVLELNSNTVLKVYHQVKPKAFESHLKSLSSISSPHFIVPIDVLYTDNGKVAGFSMEYVNLSSSFLFNNLFNKGFCNSNKITPAFKKKLLMDIRTAVEELHAKNIQIGDLQMYNLFFQMNGSFFFVDVDSFQTSTQPHSGVLLAEITDFTTSGVTKETDAYAYDILSFWAQHWVHPYKWVAKGNQETLEQRVRAKKSVLSMIPDIKLPALYEAPVGHERTQYEEIFNKGRRYMVDLSGAPVAQVNIVVKQPIHSQSLQVQEIAEGILNIHSCNNYFTAENKMGWVLYEANILRVLRAVHNVQADEMYPAEFSNYAYRRGDRLYRKDGNFTTFYNPEFYYNAGSLSVLSYGENIQTNYNLNNQMAGIDNTQTPVFAKSVLYRGAPIQNFGAAKFLNIPVRNTYTMIPILFTTKDAYYSGGFFGVEYLKHGKATEYMISNGKGQMSIDYLPHFAVKNNTIFVPEDGYISVCKDWVEITRLDAPCSRTSRLYSTTSGILCLENNILYLLNTK